MKDYSRQQYEQLISIMKETYGFKTVSINQVIVELAADELPIMRVAYSAHIGAIIISFHISISSLDAISFFDFIRNAFKKVKLHDSYYVDKDNNFFIGQEAYNAYDVELEAHYKANEYSKEYYDPEVPIILVSDVVIYEVTHPNALKMYRELKKKKNPFFEM